MIVVYNNDTIRGHFCLLHQIIYNSNYFHCLSTQWSNVLNKYLINKTHVFANIIKNCTSCESTWVPFVFIQNRLKCALYGRDRAQRVAIKPEFYHLSTTNSTIKQIGYYYHRRHCFYCYDRPCWQCEFQNCNRLIFASFCYLLHGICNCMSRKTTNNPPKECL